MCARVKFSCVKWDRYCIFPWCGGFNCGTKIFSCSSSRMFTYDLPHPISAKYTLKWIYIANSLQIISTTRNKTFLPHIDIASGIQYYPVTFMVSLLTARTLVVVSTCDGNADHQRLNSPLYLTKPIRGQLLDNKRACGFSDWPQWEENVPRMVHQLVPPNLASSRERTTVCFFLHEYIIVLSYVCFIAASCWLLYIIQFFIFYKQDPLIAGTKLEF